MGKRNKRKTLAKKRGVEKKAKNPNKELQKAQKKAQKGRQKDEDDLDKLLASFKAQDLAEAAVKAERAEGGRPKGRNNFSMVAHPKKKELFLFGGESYFGGRETYHRDVHRFVINKDEWYTITSNRSPLPRASHQCVVVSVHNGHFMYMFGGEFANPGGDKFRHFGDLWRMDLQTYEWEELNSGNQKQQPGPSPRSGHRMAVWKQYIVLFGGFYDTYTTTKYYNDLWLWDLHNARWHEVKFGPRTEMPAPRSACPLSVWEDTLYVFFGYSKEVKSSSSSFLPSNTQQRKKGGKKGAADEDELEDSSVGIIHSDVWSVNLVAPTTSEEEKGEESKKQTQSAPKWTKLKNKGVVPSLRVGFSMCTHKKNCVFFGGVHDDPDDGTSTFYNDLYLFNMSNQRWSPLPLLASKTQHQQQSHNKSSDDEEEAQAKEEEESKEEEEEEAHEEDPSPSAAANADELIAPAGRFKAQTCVINNTMYLFGGVMEHNKKEYYFDDLYSLDLQKHRKFEQLAGWSQAETVGRRMKKDEEAEEDSDEDSEEEESEEESEEEEEGEKGKEVI